MARPKDSGFWTPERVVAAHAEHLAGATITSIARREGMTVASLSIALKNAHLFIARRGPGVLGNQPKMTDPDALMAYDFYVGFKMTMKDLEARFGISSAALRKRWQRLGLVKISQIAKDRGWTTAEKGWGQRPAEDFQNIAAHHHVAAGGACVVCDEPMETAQYV